MSNRTTSDNARGATQWKGCIKLADGQQVVLEPAFPTAREAQEHAEKQVGNAKDHGITIDAVATSTLSAPMGKHDDPPDYVEEFEDSNGRPYWRAKIPLMDGTRTYMGPRFYNKGRAVAFARQRVAEAKQFNWTRATVAASANVPRGETCDEYMARLADSREAEGLMGAENERKNWGKWIGPHIGELEIAAPTSVLRPKLEDIRRVLNDKVSTRKKAADPTVGLSGLTAGNIWLVVRTVFAATVQHPEAEFRVRSDDPSTGIRPPRSSRRRERPFLFPFEAEKLLACVEVPVPWRQVYAVSMYLATRPEETQGLTWMDVDFKSTTVHVNKAMDGLRGTLKLPKSPNATRKIPIHPSLLPLLVVMHAQRASDDAPVAPALRTVSAIYRARLVRAHLKIVGADRTDLFADTVTLRPMDFRAFRDTGITWLGLTGVPLHRIRRRCGHANILTTDRYIRMAEDLQGVCGTPFPPLPECLLKAPATPLDELWAIAAQAKRMALGESEQLQMPRYVERIAAWLEANEGAFDGTKTALAERMRMYRSTFFRALRVLVESGRVVVTRGRPGPHPGPCRIALVPKPTRSRKGAP